MFQIVVVISDVIYQLPMRKVKNPCCSSVDKISVMADYDGAWLFNRSRRVVTEGNIYLANSAYCGFLRESQILTIAEEIEYDKMIKRGE